MASFQLKNLTTNLTYSLEVSEMYVRNIQDLKRNDKGIIIDCNTSGSVVITHIGDFINNESLPGLLDGDEFQFTNHPELSLKYTQAIKTITGSNLGIKPVGPDINHPEAGPFLYNFTEDNVGTLQLCYNSKFITWFTGNFSNSNHNYYTVDIGEENSSRKYGWVYNLWTGGSNIELGYPVTLCFDFTNNIVCLYRPFTFIFPPMSNYGTKRLSDYANASISSRIACRVNRILTNKDCPITYRIALPCNANEQTLSITPIDNDSVISNITPSTYVNLVGNLEWQNTFIYTGWQSYYGFRTIYNDYGVNFNFSLGDGYSRYYAIGYNGKTQTISTYNISLYSYYPDIELDSPYKFYYWLLNDTTESSSNPYPDNPNNPNNPQNPNYPNSIYPVVGGNGANDKSSDDIINDFNPNFNVAECGNINIYKLTTTIAQNFFKYIWNDTFFNAFVKLITNPLDAIISLHTVPFSPVTTSIANIKLGNVTINDIAAPIISNSFLQIDFGNLNIPYFYADKADYESEIYIYLPFYGYINLTQFECVNSTLNLTYNIDILTGTFTAVITMTKNIDETNLNSVITQVSGNLQYQIPLISSNYTQIISAIMTQSLPRNLITTENTSKLSANSGTVSTRRPYIIITKPIHNMPYNYSMYKGYSLNFTMQLSQCRGFTQCLAVHVDNVIGSKEETNEIYKLLLEGVIF